MNGDRKPVLSICLETLLLGVAILLFGWALYLPIAVADAPRYTPEEQALSSACERGEIVRLHIMADADDRESQRVKLAVRDAILNAFGDTLAVGGAACADDAYEMLERTVSDIGAIALACARINGFDGTVRAEVGTFCLPAKQYGRVLLPQGDYRALRVTLGSGEGQNWWCVLFPRLCLTAGNADADSGTREIQWNSLRILRRWTLLPC